MRQGERFGAAVGEAAVSLACVRRLIAEEAVHLPESDLWEGLRAMAGLRCLVEATYLDVLREVDARHGGAGSASAGLVRDITGASSGAARRDVAVARQIGPDGVLSGFGDRLAAGDVNREHVDVAVGCLDSIPSHLIEHPDDRAAVTEALYTVVDAGSGSHELKRAVRLILDRVDPGQRDRLDPNASQRQFLDMATDSTGMLVGRFQLDAAAGASLRAAVNAHSAPAPAVADSDGSVSRDPRTARRRRADALATLAEMALGVASPRRGERPRIVVHTTSDQLAGMAATSAMTESGEVLADWAARRLACDAVLQRIVVDPSLGPLDVGRERRLVTPAQRRALAARDGGCVICGAEPDWCDAHHITFWADGGASDLSNLVLVCPRHHSAVHSGEWAIDRTGDGRIVLVPPRHVDRLQRPRSPAFHVSAGVRRGVPSQADSSVSPR